MEDIALVIRSSIALLESIKAYVSVLPLPRSAHFLQWSDRRHELADLADEWTQRMPRPAPSEPRPAPASPPGLCVAMLHIASSFSQNMCSAKACKLAHVCVVPDCPDSSAQGGGDAGLQPGDLAAAAGGDAGGPQVPPAGRGASTSMTPSRAHHDEEGCEKLCAG